MYSSHACVHRIHFETPHLTVIRMKCKNRNEMITNRDDHNVAHERDSTQLYKHMA